MFFNSNIASLVKELLKERYAEISELERFKSEIKAIIGIEGFSQVVECLDRFDNMHTESIYANPGTIVFYKLFRDIVLQGVGLTRVISIMDGYIINERNKMTLASCSNYWYYSSWDYYGLIDHSEEVKISSLTVLESVDNFTETPKNNNAEYKREFKNGSWGERRKRKLIRKLK